MEAGVYKILSRYRISAVLDFHSQSESSDSIDSSRVPFRRKTVYCSNNATLANERTGSGFHMAYKENFGDINSEVGKS